VSAPREQGHDDERAMLTELEQGVRYFEGLEADNERLREALRALVVDVEDFGEPPRHYRALNAARAALEASSEPRP
jgi:hypothetical protein